MKSLQEIENYFLFIAEQLYKVDYQHQKNIISIVKKFETHKSRSQLVTDIEGDIKDTSVALKSLLSIYLKNVYLKSFNDTHKEYSIKKLFALQELKKEDLKVTGGFLDEVTPYNLSFLEQFFATYETPFMQGWEDEQKKAIFGFLEELMMTGYSYDRAERGLRKLLGENPYGMDNKTYWEMVGRTEATRVFTQASLASAKSLGYTMKRVKTVVGCERCKEFEAQGAIPINQPYENTLPNNPDIPFHPNCMCHYQYELEQGKYFSQYSYEPDKKLQSEVDLLDYNADLNKMSIEQLQRWAKTNLKTNINFIDIKLSYLEELYDKLHLESSVAKIIPKEDIWDEFIKTIIKTLQIIKEYEQEYKKPLPVFLIKFDTYLGTTLNSALSQHGDGVIKLCISQKAIEQKILELNIEYIKKIYKISDTKFKSGKPYSTGSTFESVFWHEIGHAIDYNSDFELGYKISRMLDAYPNDHPIKKALKESSWYSSELDYGDGILSKEIIAENLSSYMSKDKDKSSEKSWEKLSPEAKEWILKEVVKDLNEVNKNNND